MKKKVSIQTSIALMPRVSDRYMVLFVYCECGYTFTSNNSGCGYSLAEATQLAMTINDSIKPHCKK